jgi:arginyl-tRNA synthetase
MKTEVLSSLRDACHSFLQERGLSADGLPVSLETPPSGVGADLASSFPMAAAKKAGVPPREAAQKVISRLPGNIPYAAEISGPGFLNIRMTDAWLASELRLLLDKGESYGRRAESGRSMLIEFVSANPNGPLHVGHGRGAALGDSLARIFRHLGHKVTTEYYINDGGNQMENLGASLMWRMEELKPGFLDAEEKAELARRKPEDLYKGEYIVGIARDVLSRWGASRPHGLEPFIREGIAAVLKMIRSDLEGFGVAHDSWFPESSLHKDGAVDRALARLRERGWLEEREGALWFKSTAFGDDKDRVIKRADERPTYFAADIAYHDEKFRRGFDRMINIWGTDHHGYVARLKSVVKALGHDPDKLDILLYQLVTLLRNGQPVAMSTRSGDFVPLEDVVKEVGRDACRFFFALLSPQSHLKFDLELAKKRASENPVFYVQYVHARCRSIFREAAKRGVAPAAGTPFSPPPALDPRERALLVKLASWPDVLDQAAREMSPHPVPNHLLALAAEFHRFYEGCQVLGEDPQATAFRLALVDGVRSVIRNGLDVIGVRAPEEM